MDWVKHHSICSESKRKKRTHTLHLSFDALDILWCPCSIFKHISTAESTENTMINFHSTCYSCNFIGCYAMLVIARPHSDDLMMFPCFPFHIQQISSVCFFLSYFADPSPGSQFCSFCKPTSNQLINLPASSPAFHHLTIITVYLAWLSTHLSPYCICYFRPLSAHLRSCL